MLPPKNWKADLKAEVNKDTVRDPDTGGEREPEHGYTASLRQLASVRRGGLRWPPGDYRRQ